MRKKIFVCIYFNILKLIVLQALRSAVGRVGSEGGLGIVILRNAWYSKW